MKIQCRYSGEYFYTTDFRNLKAVGEHPMMHLPVHTLVSRMGDFFRGSMSEVECKVLFIAMLKATGQVDFKMNAQPEISTVYKYMESLANMLQWHEAIENRSIKLPMYSINNATKDLENINHWIGAWNDIKESWKLGYAQSISAKRALDELVRREEVLSRLIKSYTKKSTDYAWLLARWALLASKAPKELHELWTKLFKLKGIEVYNGEYTNDLSELVEHMENNLHHGTIYAHEVLKHIRHLYHLNQSGDFGLGIPSGTDLDHTLQNPYTFVEEDVEKHNRALAVASAPDSEPKPEQYGNKIEYIRAKAAYRLAMSKNNTDKAFEQQQQEAAKLDDLLATDANEQAALPFTDDEDDVNDIVKGGL